RVRPHLLQPSFRGQAGLIYYPSSDSEPPLTRPAGPSVMTLPDTFSSSETPSLVLFSLTVCCPSPLSELRPSRPCRLPRLRLRRLFPLPAHGKTASELAKVSNPPPEANLAVGFFF